jgi:hypothetical protein
MKRKWLEIAERLIEQEGGSDMENPRSTDNEATAMYRDAVTRVEKDIFRTGQYSPISLDFQRNLIVYIDRNHLFYATTPYDKPTLERAPGVGPGPPAVNMLRDILITYACQTELSDNLGKIKHFTVSLVLSMKFLT